MRCSVENCTNKAWARGMCNTHLGHMYRYGEIRRTPHTPNEILVDGGHAEIILYDKHGTEIDRALIDSGDVDLVTGIKWRKHHTGYAHGGHEGVGLHTVIMGQKWIDHINRNPLDCRRENLRPATPSQNSRNRKVRSDNKTGVVGVSYSKKDKCFYARIGHKGKHIHLGTFHTLEDAAKARHQAALKYHGEYAAELQENTDAKCCS